MLRYVACAAVMAAESVRRAAGAEPDAAAGGDAGRADGPAKARPASLDGACPASPSPAAPVSPATRTEGAASSPAGAAPAISVIMPVYNARRHDEDHLAAALASVAAQTYRGFELIVVDDGSTDGTARLVGALVAEHPGTNLHMILRQENGGQSSARNFGARHAAGRWLAFLDQDDEWKPDRLGLVLPLLTQDVDLVYTSADTIDVDGNLLQQDIHRDRSLCGVHPRRSLDDVLLRDAYVMPGVVTVRKEFFERLGGFDERLSGYEDDDLFARAFAAGRVRYLAVPTLRWRIYDASYSFSGRMTESRLRYWRKLLATFARHDRRRSEDITLRFFRDFLLHSAMYRQNDSPLAGADLAGAMQLLPHLGPIDRFMFGLVGWAGTRKTRSGRFAIYWFINGSDRF
jgi:glycosyltransferase involved in cell wall biosynthesis